MRPPPEPLPSVVAQTINYGPPDHTVGTFTVHTDCRHYDGGFPCNRWRPCQGCPDHEPVGSRVLVVLLEALGDVLITSPVPARIKADDPTAHITWLVYERCAPLVRLIPTVDRVLVYDWESTSQLMAETFDLVLGLERMPAAAALVERIAAERKVGLAHGGKHNGLYALTEEARPLLMMDTWNDYRTRWNRTTWTEMYLRIAGYDEPGQPAYAVRVPAGADARVRSLLGARDRPRVCLNLGGSFRQKVWPDAHWITLGRALLAGGSQVVVAGGAAEREHCENVAGRLAAEVGDPAAVVYEPFSLAEMCAVPGHCDVMVTGDSFGFHTALLHDTPCVVLFGPSAPAEVVPPGASFVTVVRSELPCSPCAHQMTCRGVGGCMDVISPEQVLAATRAHLPSLRG